MDQEAAYYIWGVDNSPYGPVELSLMVQWIAEGRVLADTWVFERNADKWGKASQFSELQAYFETAVKSARSPSLAPGSLRRIKILGNLSDVQLARLSDFMEPQEWPANGVVFRHGEMGDGMFLVLNGELRARMMNGDMEMILATFRTGDFFGDMALFDNGPRSADVAASIDSSLIKISSANFYRLVREAPALATPFLQAAARTLSSRIRADNKRLLQVSEQFAMSRFL
jgi:CRP/FNR family cyclic AMP-dependent transcriptional regulator